MSCAAPRPSVYSPPQALDQVAGREGADSYADVAGQSDCWTESGETDSVSEAKLVFLGIFVIGGTWAWQRAR